MDLPVRGFDRHGEQDPWADATPGELELALALEYEREQTNIIRAEVEAMRAQVNWIRTFLENSAPKGRIVADVAHAVVTTQPEPTAPGP